MDEKYLNLCDSETFLEMLNNKEITMCSVIGRPKQEFEELFRQGGNFYELLVHKYGIEDLEFMIEGFYETEFMIRPINIYVPAEDELGEDGFYCSATLSMCYQYSTVTIMKILLAFFDVIFYLMPSPLLPNSVYKLMKYGELETSPLFF